MPISSASTALLERGYARYDLADRLGVSESDERFTSLLAEFIDLPADPYEPEAGRYRRYGRGLYLPWSAEFQWMPDAAGNGTGNGYYQGEHNPDYSHVVRDLPTLTASTRKNPLLLDILAFDFAQTRWNPADSCWPLHVGVHLIKLSVERRDHAAFSSPNELHQDGEPFVFAHLMYRRNADGGHNVIAAPKCSGMQPADIPDNLLVDQFELTEPLQSYGVYDEKISHYVAPIRQGPVDSPGERAVILVDFTVLTQRI
jgi:hypothetical protein